MPRRRAHLPEFVQLKTMSEQVDHPSSSSSSRLYVFSEREREREATAAQTAAAKNVTARAFKGKKEKASTGWLHLATITSSARKVTIVCCLLANIYILYFLLGPLLP